MKTCTKCKQAKELTQFRKCEQAKDGKLRHCAECGDKMRVKKWRQDNKEKYNKYQKKYANRAKIKPTNQYQFMQAKHNTQLKTTNPEEYWNKYHKEYWKQYWKQHMQEVFDNRFDCFCAKKDKEVTEELSTFKAKLAQQKDQPYG